MRIAAVSDIHGNLEALDAVLADARTLGVEQFWFLGDYSAIGPEPAAVLDRLTALSGARFTRGNTDRYVVTGDLPPPDLAVVRADPALIPTYANMAASFSWTRGYLTATGWLEWLARLPLDLRLTTPDGLRVLAVHAAPGTDDGEGVHPGRSNAELVALLAGSEADLVLVGHTHQPMIRRVGPAVVVNLGSVSNPKPDDLRASYAVLEFSAPGIAVEVRRVPYDHGAFIEIVRQSGHPATDFILSYQRGEQRGREPHPDHEPWRPGERTRVVAPGPA
jgi:predicted phosphodiesterase